MPIIVYAIIETGCIDEMLLSVIDSLKSRTGAVFEIITDNSLSAIVSTSHETSLQITREVLLRYASHVDSLSQIVTLLPMQYGSVLPAIDDLRSILQNNSSTFTDALNKVSNKEEYSLRIISSPESQLHTLNNNADEPITLPEVLQGDSASKKYLLSKYQKHLAEEKYRQSNEIAKIILKNNLGSVISDLLFKKTDPAGFIVDAVLLVERCKKEELIALVTHMQTEHSEYNIILTGPWPPYNFAQIKLQ
jgi:hypothetical protein